MHIKRHNTCLKLFAAVLTAGTILSTAAVSTAEGFKAGDALPELASFQLDGKLPDSLKGKVVLLDFWASWCEPCKASFPVMNELQKTYGAQGFVVVAVNVDENAADMKDFLKDHAATFTVLHDAAQKLVAQAGIATMPSSFVIDRAGKVRFLHTGFHGEESKKQYQQEIESLLK